MTRALIDYREQRSALGEGFDPDTPVEGFYKTRLRFGGVYVGIRIWYGAPIDPVTGDEMDRGWRWQALCNGQPIPLERVWPCCAGEPVDEKEYAFFAAQQSWAEQHAPDSAYADPHRRIDLLSSDTPLPF